MHSPGRLLSRGLPHHIHASSSKIRTMASTTGRVPLLLSPAEYKKLPGSTTIPVDVSWHMPNSPRSAVAEFLSGPRLPHARRLDLDEVAELDPGKNPLSLTHMLPTAERFAEACRKLGISDDSHVVVYDSVGVFSSPRGLFTFKAFGHEKVSLLDGGLPRWIHEGGEVETGDVGDYGESEYRGTGKLDETLVRSYEHVVANSEKGDQADSEVVLDHRPLARWEGTAPEPRPNLSSGHIPHSLPLPFTSYLSPAGDSSKPYTSLKPVAELKQVLVDGVGGESVWQDVQAGKRGLVFTCGSGMTAGVGWVANELVKEAAGGENKARSAIYDESWTGYASRPESKIIKGGKEKLAANPGKFQHT